MSHIEPVPADVLARQHGAGREKIHRSVLEPQLFNYGTIKTSLDDGVPLYDS